MKNKTTKEPTMSADWHHKIAMNYCDTALERYYEAIEQYNAAIEFERLAISLVNNKIDKRVLTASLKSIQTDLVKLKTLEE